MSFSDKVKNELRKYVNSCPECEKFQSMGENGISNIFMGDNGVSIKKCCLLSYIRGVFLVCGSITDPEKDYHLEFSVSDLKSAGVFNKLLSSAYFFAKETSDSEENLTEKININIINIENIPLILKGTRRKSHMVLYQKDSEKIEDILTMMGAVQSSLSIMNVKIYKDFRNNVNRARNCDTANISKTVEVASRRIDDINFIIEKRGIDFLPPPLREIAELRLKNPENSLKELGEALNGTISRSGINHRLNKISKIAEDLRENW